MGRSAGRGYPGGAGEMDRRHRERCARRAYRSATDRIVRRAPIRRRGYGNRHFRRRPRTIATPHFATIRHCRLGGRSSGRRGARGSQLSPGGTAGGRWSAKRTIGGDQCGSSSFDQRTDASALFLWNVDRSRALDQHVESSNGTPGQAGVQSALHAQPDWPKDVQAELPLSFATRGVR